MDITSQLSEIKGIGPKNEKLLNDIGIFCIKDLLIYFPRDYENISVGKKIMDTYENEKILIKGKVLKINKDIRTKNNKTISTIELNDGTSVFKAKWFNQPYMKNKFIINEEFTLKGTEKSYKNEKILLNPTMVNSEFILDKKIQPIYPLKSGITNSMITKYISEVLRKVFISENLPEWIVNKYELCSLDDAIKNIHSPENYDKLVSAKRRIKFQELFTYSLKVLMLKEFINKDKNGISFSIADEIKTLKQSLPFTLTHGQCKVLREILLDQKSEFG